MEISKKKMKHDYYYIKILKIDLTWHGDYNPPAGTTLLKEYLKRKKKE